MVRGQDSLAGCAASPVLVVVFCCQVAFSFCRSPCPSPSTDRLSAGGPDVVPSEDYSHWPPRLAVSRRAKGDGQDKQQSTKKNDQMKTTTTAKTERRAQEQSEQVFRAQAGEFAKYIVLTWQGREQVTVFPFHVKHAEVLAYMQRECPEIEAVSAGFFIAEADTVWCNGGSESLSLSCRPDEDRQAIEEFLQSEDREQWDLTQLSAEARAEAREELAEAGWC